MSVADADYIGRFAPSPTGPLHAGSLLAAAASYLDARQAGGQWHVRIEDIDPPREVPGAADDILRTLERFGFEWDGPVTYQSQRIARFRERLNDIADRTFYCHCTRKELAAERARLGLAGDRYPGTCRERGHRDGTLRFELDTSAAFDDVVQGLTTNSEGADDFVIWRRDDLPAYQWAVSVDDVDQGITHVVRGVDLLTTTPRQIAVTRALGGALPSFSHVPILVNDSGQKLSKQTHAKALLDGTVRLQLCAAFEALKLPIARASSAESLSDLWLWAIRHWDAKRLRNKKTIPFSG